MAYSTSNPPMLIASGLGGAYNLWAYKGTDAATAVRVAGYITDGYDLGMRAGDLMLSVDTSADPITTQMMIVATATADGGVDLGNGTAVTATNSD